MGLNLKLSTHVWWMARSELRFCLQTSDGEFRKRRGTKLLTLLVSALDGNALRLANAVCQHQYRPELTLRGAKRHACTGTHRYLEEKNDSQLRQMQKIVLHIHVMKDTPANQRGRGWVENGNSSEGEHGEIKAALRS